MYSQVFRRIFFLLLLVLIALGAAAGPAAAQTGQGGATIAPDSAPINTDFTVSASGFKAGSVVEATIDSFDIGAQATAASNGMASVTFRSSSVGIHRVRLEGVNASDAPHGPSAAFTVRGAPCTSGCSPLPRTGADTGRLALLGVALVAGGLFMITRDHINGKHFKGAARRYTKGAGAAVVAGALVIGVAQLAEPPAAQAASHASISGKATNGSSATGVAGVCVQAANASSFGMALTAADGTYTISNLPAGRYNVGFVDCALKPTFFTEYHGGSRNWNQATAVDLADGQAASGKDAQLDSGAVAVGRVTDAAGAGVPDACVLMGLTNNSIDPDCRLTSRASGAFFSDSMAPGSYIVVFVDSAGTRAIKYNGGTNDSASSTKVALVAGQETSGVGAVLPVAGTVSGKVTEDASGAAPSRQVCVADFSNDTPTVASSFVGADGTFTIAQLGAGNHKVKFFDCEGSGTPYAEQFYNAKSSLSAADPVAVASGQDKANINAQMTGSSSGPTTTRGAGATTTTTAAGATTTTTAAGATTTTAAGATTTTAAGATTTTTVSPAPRASDGPASTSTSTVTPGDSLTISGGGFRAGSQVDAIVYSAPRQLGTTTADGSGNVSMRVTIPRDLAPGSHVLQLQGFNPSNQPRTLSTTITVRGILPRTGPDSPWPAAAGTAVLTLAVAVLAGRRRVIGLQR